MSVTCHAHRTGTRDFFETPAHATRALLNHPEVAAIVADPGARIVEPAAGNGAILRVLREAGVARERLTAVELESGCHAALKDLAAVVVCPFDTLRLRAECGIFTADLVVTNPPFADDGMSRFARTALDLVHSGGLVALFGRHDWIVPAGRDRVLAEIGYPDVCATVRRSAFIRIAECALCRTRWTLPASHGPAFEHPPGVHGCADRQLSARTSSDTNAYAWFLWRRGERRSAGQHMRLREQPGVGAPVGQGVLL